MQTLIDPFELASRTLPTPRPATDVASSFAEIDVQLEEDAAPERRPSRPLRVEPPGLRCWCSED